MLLAASRGHTGTVQCLLAHGADRTITDNGGNTPLSLAACHGHIASLELLLAHGDGWKRTVAPTGRAYFWNLESKAVQWEPPTDDVNHRNANGDSALLIACRKGHLAVVDALISHCALIDQPDAAEDTPLLLAATFGPFLQNTSLLCFLFVSTM